MLKSSLQPTQCLQADIKCAFQSLPGVHALQVGEHGTRTERPFSECTLVANTIVLPLSNRDNRAPLPASISTSSQLVPGRNQPFSMTSKKNGVPGYGAATWNRAISSGSFFDSAIVSWMDLNGFTW